MQSFSNFVASRFVRSVAIVKPHHKVTPYHGHPKERLRSGKHPTAPSRPPTRTPALAPNEIHLVFLLDHSIRWPQCDRHILLIPARDQSLLLQHFRVREQFVLVLVVDVFLNDDVLVVVLRLISMRNRAGDGRQVDIPYPTPMANESDPALLGTSTCG